MNQPRVNRPPWTCDCGRKVPAHIEACRCGKARPTDVGASGAVEWAEQQAAASAALPRSEGLFGTKSLLQVGGVILVLGLFFGSRYFNRYRASREVRATMISSLSKDLGEEMATGLADKVHWPCFEPNYHMSFRRRGGRSTFDEEKYTACALRALEREAGEIRVLRQKAVANEGRAGRTPTDATASLPPGPPKAQTAATSRNDERVASLSERASPASTKPDRIKALEELGKLGEVAQASVPVFLLALEDSDEMVRNSALLGFRRLRPDPDVGLPALRSRLKDSYAINQALAAGSLADLGRPEEAVMELIPLLRGRAGMWASTELGHIPSYAKPAVPALIEMLEQRVGSSDGYSACSTLAAIGHDAEAALPALRAAANDPDKSLSGMAAYAIRQIERR